MKHSGTDARMQRRIERAARSGRTLSRRDDAALVAAYCQAQQRREPLYAAIWIAAIALLVVLRVLLRERAIEGAFIPLAIGAVKAGFWHMHIRNAEEISRQFADGGPPPDPSELLPDDAL